MNRKHIKKRQLFLNSTKHLLISLQQLLSILMNDDDNESTSDDGDDGSGSSSEEEEEPEEEEKMDKYAIAMENFRIHIVPHLLATKRKREHTIISFKYLPARKNPSIEGGSTQMKCRVCQVNSSEWCIQCTMMYDLGKKSQVCTPIHSNCLIAHKKFLCTAMKSSEEL